MEKVISEFLSGNYQTAQNLARAHKLEALQKYLQKTHHYSSSKANKVAGFLKKHNSLKEAQNAK